jgi:hypothetical protein
MRWWLLVLLGLVAGPVSAVEPARPNIDPLAQQHVKRMSDYLASLQSFRVDAHATDERVTTDGQKLQFVASSRVSVRRPDRLRTDRIGAFADVVLRYDGKNYSVFGNRTGYYAVAPAPPTLDEAIDTARARYGIDAPAADLYVSRPYDEMIQEAQGGRYIGLEPIDGVLCHHLAFQGKDVDWQIWIQDGPQPLPRRYVVTTKDQAERPEFTVSLSDWQPNAPLGDSLFTFVPPPGAQRIQLMPLSAKR